MGASNEIPRLNSSILLVTDNSPWGPLVARHLRLCSTSVKHFTWQHGSDFGISGVDGWTGDWIIGFKADYILSVKELQSARSGVINFHPAPPSLRGVGTYQVALEEGYTTYGVTCHHMAKQIDAGPIIATRDFPIPGSISSEELEALAAAQLFALLVEILCRIRNGVELPRSSVHWSGPLHTWKEHHRRVGEMACQHCT